MEILVPYARKGFVGHLVTIKVPTFQGKDVTVLFELINLCHIVYSNTWDKGTHFGEGNDSHSCKNA